MDINLSEDAKKLLTVLYCQYLNKRKESVDPEKAREMGDLFYLTESINTRCSLMCIDELLRELEHAGYLNIIYEDEVIMDTFLSVQAVTRMENILGSSEESVVSLD